MTPLGRLVGCRGCLPDAHAAAEVLAERPVPRQRRGAGGHKVAEPGQPGEGLRVGPERRAETRGLGEPTGDDRRACVVAEPHAHRHADREGDDVLHRAAELAPDHVDVGVGPEVRRGAAVLDLPRDGRIRARHHCCCRLAGSDLAGEVRTAHGGDPVLRNSRHLLEHLGHPLGRAQLDALHQADEHRVVGQQVHQLRQVVAEQL
jgi:hypothetical protein